MLHRRISANAEKHQHSDISADSCPAVRYVHVCQICAKILVIIKYLGFVYFFVCPPPLSLNIAEISLAVLDLPVIVCRDLITYNKY